MLMVQEFLGGQNPIVATTDESFLHGPWTRAHIKEAK